MVKERECDGCGNEFPLKKLGKIRGKYLCKKCRTDTRENHRKETIEMSKRAEKGYQEAEKKRERRKAVDITEPKIKGSKKATRKEKSQSYLTFHERQDLFRILVKRGIDSEEAKERIQNLVDEQEKIRNKMKQKNKSDEDVKQKQQSMLEEMWQN